MDEVGSYRRAMIVVAHPDDAEYGCSGTVALWSRQDVEVIYVICTDGSKGSSDPNVEVEKLVKIRQKEQRDACRVLGVKDVVFLGYEDAMLEPTLALRKDLTREIRRYKPDALICGNPVRDLSGQGYLGHPDHFAAAEAAMSAVFPAARDRMTFPDLLAEGLEPHKVRDLLVMDREKADTWIDISETIDVAIDGLRQHVSQVGRLGEEHLEWLKAHKQRAGELHDMKFAEGFKLFRLD